jgi:hypothetical protein
MYRKTTLLPFALIILAGPATPAQADPGVLYVAPQRYRY